MADKEMEVKVRLAGDLDKSLVSALKKLESAVNNLDKKGSKSSLQRMQSGLNSIQKAVGKAESKFKSLGNSTTAFEKINSGIDKIKQGLDTKGAKAAFGLFDGIEKGARKAVKGTATVVKAEAAFAAAAATGIGALAAKSLSYYSDYEQLVGGVDTLFKGSSQTVQNYANNAYKTAGISANQYMETVTAFSASLINSLGGDTAQAASMANMAITDMSDNANKMGTDMSEIQRAYQSLARGNYGMLDNLKLGYGGTKSEMQRLIKDANELEKAQGRAGDLQIGKFADVVQAIHDVQENMDITGTTAKEAATTIEGSMNSARAAWANWLTGLGNENADMNGLTTQLMDSIGTAASNIIPRLQVILTSIGSFLTSNGPQIVQSLVSGVMSALGTLLPVGASVIMSLAQGIVASAPQILSAGFQILAFLAQGIASSMPQVISMGAQLLSSFANACSAYLPMLIPLGVQAVLNFVMGLAQNLPSIAASAGQILVALAQGIAQSIPLLVQQGPQIIMALVQGIIGAVGELLSAGWQIVQILGQAILDGLANIGGMIGDFFVGLFTGQQVEAPEIDTSSAEASLQSVPESAQSAAQETANAFSGIDLGTFEPPDTSGIDMSGISAAASAEASNANSILSTIGSGASVSVGSADFSAITAAAQAAADNVRSTFTNLGSQVAAALSAGIAGAGNSFAVIVTSAQSAAASITAAFTGVGSGIGSAVQSGLSMATAAYASFTSAATSSASQVMAVQMAAANMVRSIWVSSLTMISARATATVAAFMRMGAAGQSAASIITSAMSGVAATISGISSSAYSAASALNAMAAAARSASSAAASASSASRTAQLARFAHGGFTNGPSLAGEDPRYPHEAVISFNPAVRKQNQRYLSIAAQRLGMSVTKQYPWTTGGSAANSGGYVRPNIEANTTVDVGGITFSPNITINGSANEGDIMSALRKVQPEFCDLVKEVIAESEVGSYAYDI